ncbi:hypothetical protein QVD17_41553 [Tagetes erecta]|uniref:Uncharacterized protein n=1 Tax=Tagetes erecta TaxID=13708 RepID=A0AAD8JPE1_TARER|nr:hypothetical protein QVD17_41501 [Tagetes erecta]KAK1406262.1 hypothetical protein QVD17_41553 [Tagetes erecta]
MRNKNSLAAKVTNIDGLPRRGILRKAEVGNVKPDKGGMETNCAMPIDNAEVVDKTSMGVEGMVETANHGSMKCKQHGNRIEVIKDGNGVLHEGVNVPTAFVSHFQQFLGCDEALTTVPSPELFEHRLEINVAENMAYFVL